jgi:glycosyltransferase A (GT-A) superfamily protein (DUF2064 family)
MRLSRVFTFTYAIDRTIFKNSSTTMSHKLLSANYPTLVVFCKRPKLNQGKQRLVEAISAPQAFVIAKALLACAIEDTKAWQGPVVIATSDESDVEWAQSLNKKAQVMTQLPSDLTGNLGERLNYVDHVLRALGHQQMVIIGTDAPMLNDVHYQTAITSLNEHDVVLSHADDGGVVIMANSAPWPNMTALPWSTQNLSHALAQACRDEELSVHYATPGYDIDYVADLEKLTRDLTHDHRPARQALLATINQLFISTGVTNHA